MGLEAGHDADREMLLAGQGADGGGDGTHRDASNFAQQAPMVETILAEPLGEGEDDLSMRYRREERGAKPLRPDGETFGLRGRSGTSQRNGPPAMAGRFAFGIPRQRFAPRNSEPGLGYLPGRARCQVKLKTLVVCPVRLVRDKAKSHRGKTLLFDQLRGRECLLHLLPPWV